MPSKPELKFLLDEHYPGWLAESLRSAGLDVVSLTADRSELRGVNDTQVLGAAVAEQRVVVTEDVTTFGIAMTAVPNHIGVVFCHQAQFPRTKNGSGHLMRALIALVEDPPHGLGNSPVAWWLQRAD